jgi:hypothetical protein
LDPPPAAAAAAAAAECCVATGVLVAAGVLRSLCS